MTDQAMARRDNDEKRAITASDPSRDLNWLERMGHLRLDRRSGEQGTLARGSSS
jgi:hypothetical protein